MFSACSPPAGYKRSRVIFPMQVADHQICRPCYPWIPKYLRNSWRERYLECKLRLCMEDMQNVNEKLPERSTESIVILNPICLRFCPMSVMASVRALTSLDKVLNDDVVDLMDSCWLFKFFLNTTKCPAKYVMGNTVMAKDASNLQAVVVLHYVKLRKIIY